MLSAFYRIKTTTTTSTTHILNLFVKKSLWQRILAVALTSTNESIMFDVRMSR